MINSLISVGFQQHLTNEAIFKFILKFFIHTYCIVSSAIFHYLLVNLSIHCREWHFFGFHLGLALNIYICIPNVSHTKSRETHRSIVSKSPQKSRWFANNWNYLIYIFVGFGIFYLLDTLTECLFTHYFDELCVCEWTFQTNQ